MDWLDGVQNSCILKMSLVSSFFPFWSHRFSFVLNFFLRLETLFLCIHQVSFTVYFMPGTRDGTVKQADPCPHGAYILVQANGYITVYILDLFSWDSWCPSVPRMCCLTPPPNFLGSKWLKMKWIQETFKQLLTLEHLDFPFLKRAVHIAAEDCAGLLVLRLTSGHWWGRFLGFTRWKVGCWPAGVGSAWPCCCWWCECAFAQWWLCSPGHTHWVAPLPPLWTALWRRCSGNIRTPGSGMGWKEDLTLRGCENCQNRNVVAWTM